MQILYHNRQVEEKAAASIKDSTANKKPAADDPLPTMYVDIKLKLPEDA